MKPQLLLLVAFSSIFGRLVTAQTLDGNWKGTSVCQIKNSPCHDEIVVYHISGDNQINSYDVDAAKIVDGKEDHMGILKFSFDPKQKTFYSVDSVRQVKWEFKVTGNEMHGTLIAKGKVYRVVELKKEE